MKKITVIIGPTASGKSELGITLAKEKNAAIISADAFQVYQEFNIGTGKLMPNEMQGIKHFLIDEYHPETPYSVQDFLDQVTKTTNDNKDQNYIICG